MTTAIQRKHRNYAFNVQGGRCIYCNCPMWTGDVRPFIKRFALTADQAALFECTAEHKVAQKDGGKNTRSNIAAACWDCNHHRHAGDPGKAMDFLTYSIYVAWQCIDGTAKTLKSAAPIEWALLAQTAS